MEKEQKLPTQNDHDADIILAAVREAVFAGKPITMDVLSTIVSNVSKAQVFIYTPTGTIGVQFNNGEFLTCLDIEQVKQSVRHMLNQCTTGAEVQPTTGMGNA